MIVVSDKKVGFTPTEPQQSAPEAPPATTGEAIGSAFTLFNWPYRVARYAYDRGIGATLDPEHNPWDMIKDTKYASDPARFAHSYNAAETQAIMYEWDQDEQARETFARSGTFGTAAAVGAGLVDPTIFMPIGKFFSGLQSGQTALRLGADTAIAGGASAAIGEAAMYATTPDYNVGDVATGIGTGTILAGILGAGAGALLSRVERKSLETKLHQDRVDWGNDVLSFPKSAGAAATDTRQLELVRTPADIATDVIRSVVPDGIKDKIPNLDITAKLSPTRRLFNSPFVSARRATADLAETPYIFKENLEGIATTQGPSLDRLARNQIGQSKVAIVDKLEDTFTRYRFGAQDPNILQRQATHISDALGRPRDKASYTEFKSMIDDALRNGDMHEVPEVAEAAQFLRKNVLDPWKDRAIKAGLLPEDVDPGTAASYMSRLWNKEKLIAQRPVAVERFTQWLSSEQTRKAGLKTKLEGLSKELDDTQTEIAKLYKQAKGDTDGMIAVKQREAQQWQQIEDALKEWKGKSANEAISAMKARDTAVSARQPDAPRLTGADNATTRAIRRIIASDQEKTVADLQSRSSQIVDRIIGNPDGRIPYDDASIGTGVPTDQSARGPLASREFMIPDNMVRDFLNTDIEESINAYLNTVVPDVLLTEKFGDVDMLEAFRKLREEHDALSSRAKTEKERAQLKKQYDAAVTDLAAIRDRVRGTYGFSSDPRMRRAGQIVGTVGKANMTADLGGVTLASIPDVAGSIWHYGFASAFKYQWAPMMRMMSSPEMRKAANGARQELKALGLASETYLQMRAGSFNDFMEMYKPTSRFERAIDQVSNKFFLTNLLTPWTDFGKWGAGMVSMNEMSNAVEAIVKGSAKKGQVRKLAESGIDAHMAARIWKELETEGGSNVIDGVRVTNTGNWTDIGARDAFEGALGRDIDMMIITPGQEKLLLQSRNPAAALILQYKTFVQSATERLLFRGMQTRDVQALQGMIAAIGLGMMGEAAYNLAAGKENPNSTANWVKQGVSRSGVLGWLETMNAISSKWTGGQYDAFRMIGANEPLSRYQSQEKLGILLGPTANKLEGLIRAGTNASTGDWSDADTRRLRRVMPFQNLFYFRRLLDQVGEQ
ncbi:hypothetical protein WH297_19255 [Ochrobactrum vermis]|uniref:Uncharacterized protein n=1 Tax=Ochrobactrum vermis TaxID=1827297 RepID=A0ABU8PHX2_9HYPH|nr:hypothetical protein [Ochrobactrum vermis]PQZ26166.1 hypothetical protein CQZ93_19555 [Ochrobactrum vermis]